jgi:hypothetical protein
MNVDTQAKLDLAQTLINLGLITTPRQYLDVLNRGAFLPVTKISKRFYGIKD